MDFSYRMQHENWSWTAIPVVFLTALYGRIWYGIFGRTARFYNPLCPRSFAADCAGNDAIPETIKGRIIRAEASVSNGIESLPLFVAGVIAANVEGLSLWTLNVLCLSYIVIRIFYNWVYIQGQDIGVPVVLRTFVWLVSIVIIGILLLAPGRLETTYWFSTAVKMRNQPQPEYLA